MTERPLKIAGAGPAGLAAAITLARGGRQVEVYESRQDVGSRFIGDLQVIENASEAELVPDLLKRIGIETNFYFRPAMAATFFDGGGTRREVASSSPYAYFVRRGPEDGTLDRGLLAQARDAGAKLIFGQRLPIEQADIIATGPSTPDGLAKEITFATGSQRERVDVFFDHVTSPGGYSYLFILDGRATFGCAIVSDFKRIDDYFEAALRRVKTLDPFELPDQVRTGYSYMNFHLKERATIGTTPVAGEAAGFQDYLFGLGIRYALTTGHLAARSILEQRSYDELWKSALGRKQHTSLVNRYLYEAGGNLGLSFFVRRAAAATDFRRYLASWHRSAWWKRLLESGIRRLWHHSGRCQHKPPDHWCRSRDTEMRVPPLGPVADDQTV